MTNNIYWAIPDEIKASAKIDKTQIYTSSSEQGTYTLVSTIDLRASCGSYITTFSDTNAVSAGQWYLVRFLNSSENILSKYYITFKEISPRELRIADQIRRWLPPSITNKLDDFDYQNGITLGLKNFNTFPPETNFTVSNFPYGYENFLVMSSTIMVIMSKYLNISFYDINFTDSGLSIPIERGEKMRNIMAELLKMYNEMLKPAKLEIGLSGGVGLGTIQIPMGGAGRIAGSLLNILDAFGHHSSSE